MIYPNTPAIRKELGSVSADIPDDADFLKHPEVIELFRTIFKKHNAENIGSSTRIERFLFLSDPAQFDRHETTDKGYVNQNAVLTNYAGLLEDLYKDPPPAHVLLVDEPPGGTRVEPEKTCR